ncbi:Protein ecm33 [Smittium culicis]|uniref:Protein ecm33 n=1 Tax=Smittium culicis TaxID=133412 RepID=A0A1R1YIA1_9FUNG|nr:Protein ecm33 [Smittium culicis]
MLLLKLSTCLIFLANTFVSGQSCKGDFAIGNQQDVDRIAKCTQYVGDITVNQYKNVEIDLDKLQELSGNLYVSNSFNLRSLSLNNLVSIKGDMVIEDNVQLLALGIPLLNRVQKFRIVNAPNLQTLNSQAINFASKVEITQTSISELRSLAFKNITSVEINSNLNLKYIEMTNLAENSGYFNIIDNHSETSLSLPNLKVIGGNATFKSLSSISVPNLRQIMDTLNIIENPLQTLQFEALRQVNKDLVIIDNNQMTKIRFPELTTIKSGLIIQNNTNYHILDDDSFPKLKNVDDKILITGPIDSVSFPGIKLVNKAVTIKSTGKIDCVSARSNFSFLNKDRWICQLSTSKPSSTSNSGGTVNRERASSASRKSSNNYLALGAIFLSALFIYIQN